MEIRKIKMFKAILIFLLLVSILAVCITTSIAQTEQVLLRLSHSGAESGIYAQTYKYFSEQVEKESQGSVKVQYYFSGSLISDAEVLENIMAGTVDISHFQTSYVSTTISELIPFEIPGCCSFSKDIFPKFDEITTPIIQDIFKKYGAIYLGPLPQTTLVFIGDREVHSPADLEGALVRTSGKWFGDAVTMWGGTPMTISIGDLPTSLERGVVDLACTAWAAVEDHNLYEVADFCNVTNIMEVFAGLIISEKSWNKLSNDQKEAIKRAWETASTVHMDRIDAGYKDLLKLAEENNCKIYELTDNENESFKDVSNQLLEQVKEVSGTALIDGFKKLN